MRVSIHELDPNECNRENPPFEVLISIIIAFGLLISYLPQHYRIISTKSSDGLSPWFLLLGTLSSTCSFFNIFILQFHMIKCCSIVTGVQCFENTLGITQLAIQFSMFALILTLFMLYFPPQRKILSYLRHIHFNSPPTGWSKEWRDSIGIAIFVTVHFILTVIISICLLKFGGSAEDYPPTKYWADALGVASMLFASVQYFPQIIRTWRRKSVGALSIPMMLMQTPGSFLFVYSLAIRPGTRWTTWFVFLVTGCLQGTLLVMCICWHFRAKRLGYGPFYVGETDSDGKPLAPHEQTRLLGDGHSTTSSRYDNTVHDVENS
ncbi:pq loop repeat protein [Gigaspora margarita]|uniref:Pq loop repeat protein n=1 Tax=Gigaspora margarita TaxID=4874 RepID=A0A8H4APR0_GIGMA|nr:pq loop repeat protein [Gigaspora margarita]